MHQSGSPQHLRDSPPPSWAIQTPGLELVGFALSILPLIDAAHTPIAPVQTPAPQTPASQTPPPQTPAPQIVAPQTPAATAQNPVATTARDTGWLCTCTCTGGPGKRNHTLACAREQNKGMEEPVTGSQVVMLPTAVPQWGIWYVRVVQPSKVIWAPVLDAGRPCGGHPTKDWIIVETRAKK